MLSNALSVLLSPPVAPLPGHRILYRVAQALQAADLLAQATVLLCRSGLDVRLEIAGVDDVPKLEAAAVRPGLLPLGPAAMTL